MALPKFQVKVFRRPVSELDELEEDIAEWLSKRDASNYIVQSMAQSSDVTTVYAASEEDWQDTAYVTITYMAVRIPTP